MGFYGLVQTRVEPGGPPPRVPLPLSAGLYLEGQVHAAGDRPLEVGVRPHGLPVLAADRWCRAHVGGDGRFSVFSTVSSGAEVRVLDALTGEVLWTGPLEVRAGRVEVTLP